MTNGPDLHQPLPYVHVADAFIRHPDTGAIAVVHRADGSWWLPGGRVDEGESFVDAAQRETAEETGLDVEITGVLAITEEIGVDRHVVFVTCAARWLGGEPTTPAEGDEIREARWVSDAEAVELLPDYPVRSALLTRSPGAVPHFVEDPAP